MTSAIRWEQRLGLVLTEVSITSAGRTRRSGFAELPARPPPKRTGSKPRQGVLRSIFRVGARDRGEAGDAPRRLNVGSRPEESIDLDDEGATSEARKAPRKRVPVLVVDDEEFASGTVFPSQPCVDTDSVTGGVVLQ